MGFLSKIFRLKKSKSKLGELDKLCSGDFVFVKFKSPNEIGLVSTSHNLTLMRLNPEEAALREIKGVVTYNNISPPPLKTRVIEVVTYSSPSMPGLERKMTFLEDEIEEIRKINE